MIYYPLNPKSNSMLIKKSGDAEDYKVKKDDIAGLLVRFYITADDPGSPYSMWVMEFEPSGYAKMHSHREEHCLYVLEGACNLKGGDGVEYTACAGDCVFIPPCEEHEILNAGDVVLKMLSLMPIPEGASGRSTTPCGE